MIKPKAGKLMPHELPHDELLDGLPKLTGAAPTSISDFGLEETSRGRLHVYNDGNICVDIALYFKTSGDRKTCRAVFEAIGRMEAGGEAMTEEEFLLAKPVPSDVLRHIREDIGGFNGPAGKALLDELIEKTLDSYDRAAKPRGALM